MRKSLLVIFCALSLLTGCATANRQKITELETWAVESRAQAQAGKIKWSDYYKSLFKKLSDGSYGDQTHAMELSSNMIDMALLYEDGKIDKNTFESFERRAEVSSQKNSAQQGQEQDQARRAALAAGMQSLSKSFEQRQQFHQNQLNKQKTCTTRWTGYAWESTCN
jgi:major membrane immunogen (membrane-anchored lipoprotein)